MPNAGLAGNALQAAPVSLSGETGGLFILFVNYFTVPASPAQLVPSCLSRRSSRNGQSGFQAP